MLKKFTRVFQRDSGGSTLRPEGETGISRLGHRAYVGGMWGEIGRLQLDFLIEEGLTPRHCLLDIGCGALRGGVHFINYLDVGNYLGIDKERKLIELGVELELGREVYDARKPEFIVSKKFEFDGFSKRPQFSLAQSLFTHLTSTDIHTCYANLRMFVHLGHVFFATFFEGDSSNNPAASHSHACFRYSREEMERFGARAGWEPTYVGDWRHPRSQMMMKYEAV